MHGRSDEKSVQYLELDNDYAARNSYGRYGGVMHLVVYGRSALMVFVFCGTRGAYRDIGFSTIGLQQVMRPLIIHCRGCWSIS